MVQRLRNEWRRMALGMGALLACLLIAPGMAQADELVVAVNGQQVKCTRVTLEAAGSVVMGEYRG